MLHTLREKRGTQLFFPELQYLWLIWIISSLSLIRIYIYVIAYKSRMIAKPAREKFGTPRMIFQITTKGNIPIVQETVNRINDVCKEIDYRKYEIWTVTDANEEFSNCRTIVVPKEYTCNAIHKGRALQYAVEIRKAENKNGDDLYIFHLDDESLISKQTLCSVLSFLEDNATPISEGLIVYPVKNNEKIRITHLLDALRPFCCFECLDFMSRGHPAYMHGSNLLVRSDIEQKVGWENGKTISEDSLFAVSARLKFGKDVFGWHGGVIEEKSPLNIHDFVRQRKRWFYGLIQNLKYIPLKDRISQTVRAFLWSLGFFSGMASFIALFVYQNMLTDFLKYGFFITTGLWFLSYQIGAFLNGKYLPRAKRIWFHFLILLTSLGLGVIESAIPLLALISKPKTFEVIRK